MSAKKTSKFNVNVPSEVETEFRKIAIERHGMKQGNLTLAVVEAMKDYVKKYKK